MIDDVNDKLSAAINDHASLFNSIDAKTKGTYTEVPYDTTTHNFDESQAVTHLNEPVLNMVSMNQDGLLDAIDDHADLIGKLRVEKTIAEFNALSQAEKDNPEIVYYITDAEQLSYPVQDDGTATDLTDGALATGRTLESYIGTLLKPSVWSLSNNGCVMIKIGKVVTCHFRGLGGLNNWSAAGGAELIDSAHAGYRPYLSILGIGLIWNSDSANYICTIEISTTGVMTVKYKNAINTRAGSISTSYALYGSLSWITA